MSDSGVFIDIFARLNMASVSKVLGEMNSTFRRGGEEAGTAFSEGATSGLMIMQDEFRSLSRVSNEAYISMQRGLADLQVSEARINELRARSFSAASDEMIAAQRRVDEAIANTQRLVEASAARSSEARAAAYAPVPMGGGRGGGEEEEDRGRGRREPVPVGRGGGGSRIPNMLGAGATIGAIIGGIDVTKQAAQLEDSLNRLVTVTGEQQGNIKLIQDAIAQISTKTGYNPQDLATVALQGEKRGYRGNDLAKLLDVTAQLSREEKIPLEEALQGITITAQNYKIKPDDLANVASQLNVAVGRSGTTMQGFVGALPNIEQRAAAAGISREEIWGVLAQMTKSGLSAERASQNEDNLVRSLSAPNGPARDMINTLFTQAGAKGPDGQPLTDAYIMNNLGKLGITGAVNTVMNQGVLPNLTEGQRVLLPAVFKNEQVKENIESMKAELHSKAALDFVENNKEFTGGMLPGFKIRNTSKNGIGTKLLAEGASPEEIDRLSQMAVQFQNLGGFGAQLKNRDSDVQSITGVLRKAFGTVEASRAAMIIGAGDNPQQAQAQTAETVHAIADAHADAKGNVEGFNQAMDTAVGQTDRAKASWHNVANTLGKELTPAVKNVMSGLADFGQWLSEHQGVLDAFAATLGTIAAVWTGDKLLKGLKSFVEPTKNLLGAIGSKTQQAMPNTGIITSGGPGGPGGAAGAAGMAAGAEEAAPKLAAGIVTGSEEGSAVLRTGVAEGITGSSAALTSAVTAGGKGAAAEISSGVTAAGARAGEEMGGAITAAGGRAGAEMGEAIVAAGGRAAEEEAAAGRGIAAGMAGQIAALAAGMEVPKADHALQQQDWWKRGTGGGFWQNPLGATTNAFLGAQEWLGNQSGLYNGPVQFGSPPGRAHGGIVGYRGGGKVKTANPSGQPLLGQPDMGGDSLLGLLPGGMPIGLRGGEGILTPETVARLGGKSGIDALNSGEVNLPGGHLGKQVFREPSVKGDPWADPIGVGATFYGSFAKGFAKSSKWGKYLEASSQSIDSLIKDSRNAEEIGGRGGKGRSKKYGDMTEAQFGAYLSTLPPDQLAAMGVTTGKRGGLTLPDGTHIPSGHHQTTGGDSVGRAAAYSPANEAAVHAVFSQYFPEDQWQAYRNLEMHEAGFDPLAHNPSGAHGVGQFMPYTWGTYGTSAKTDDLVTQAKDQMMYIRGRYGSPSAAWNQYYNHPKGEGSYSRGGIVGFDRGGIVPGSGSTDPFGGVTGSGSYAGNIFLGADGHATADKYGGVQGHSGDGRRPEFTQPGKPNNRGPAQGSATAKGPFEGQSGKGTGQEGVKAPPPGAPGGPPPPPPEPVPHAGAGFAQPYAPADTTPGSFGAPSGDRNILDNPSRQGGMENKSKGFGAGGGLIGMAESAASMAAGAFSGGAGGEASQMAFQLVNRAIGYGGQLAGIAASGLLETFLPNNSPLADPTNSLIGKVALGIAGAHPGGKNTAGDSAMQIKPKEGLDQGAKTADGRPVPMIHMDHPEIHNHGQQDWNGMQSAIGQATFGMDIHR